MRVWKCKQVIDLYQTQLQKKKGPNSSLDESDKLLQSMEVYLETVTYFMCYLLFENGCFVKF